LKSIIFILVVLFFVVNPVSGQLLSDATGLINRFDVNTSGHTFEIILTSNFDLTDHYFDKDEKQLVLYIDSGLENNLGEIIIPQNLLSGDFDFYLNDQEFFPKIQSNEKIHFITLEFFGSGTNVVKINATEYLSGLDEIIFIENNISEKLDDADFLPPDGEFNDTPNDYLMWLIIGGIIIIVIIFGIIKFLKNKN
jgi:hypothetical protein